MDELITAKDFSVFTLEFTGLFHCGMLPDMPPTNVKTVKTCDLMFESLTT